MFRSVGSFFKRYPHWKMLLYWPLYGLAFELLEWAAKPSSYHVMYCPLDDKIPFMEIFILPYYLWFFALIWIHVYTFFKEPEVFRKLMVFVMCTQTIAVLIFAFFPSIQYLRPEVMPRDNIFTDMVSCIYAMDTNTNVCPSLHVIGGIGVWLAAMQCKSFSGKAWRTYLHISTILICISTVFLKQHSVIDIPVALIVCLVGYIAAYSKLPERIKYRKKLKA